MKRIYKLIMPFILITCAPLVAQDNQSSQICPYQGYKVSPYIITTGGLAWFESENINNQRSFKQNKSIGAFRVAAGLKMPVKRCFALTSEMAWGWYGYKHYKNSNTANYSDLYITVWGFDLLAGFKWQMFEYMGLFFKGGACMEIAYIRDRIYCQII